LSRRGIGTVYAKYSYTVSEDDCQLPSEKSNLFRRAEESGGLNYRKINKMMKKITRGFAEKELAPGIAERDQKEEFDRGLFDTMGAIGLTGICFLEQYGGVGGTIFLM